MIVQALGALRIAPRAFALVLATLLTAAATQPARTPPLSSQPVDVVMQAFDLLMDQYVQPLDSAALFTAAWAQIAPEAAPPAFTGDRDTDQMLFRQAFARVPTATAAAAIRGMVAYCNEHHTQYLDPAAYQRYVDWSHGQMVYAGIGVRVKGAQRTITQVYPGSPAEQVGLLPGDAVVAVDGTPLETSTTAAQVSSLVRGPEGSLVQIGVRRGDQTLSFSARRQRVSVNFVTARTLDGDVGYVALRGFADQEVAGTLEQDLQGLLQQGARAVVLDLRDNDGGRLDVGDRLLSDFLPVGTPLFQELSRSGGLETPTADTPDMEPIRLRLVVLVNEDTASMGEIFASALQEHAAATIVGVTTAGEVAQARTYALADGSGLQVTERQIVSASGKPLNGVGVHPDVLVADDPSTTRPGVDPALDQALALIGHPAAT